MPLNTLVMTSEVSGHKYYYRLMSGTEHAAEMITKLESAGYTRTDRNGAAMLHKRELRLSRFSVVDTVFGIADEPGICLLYTSPSPRDS